MCLEPLGSRVDFVDAEISDPSSPRSSNMSDFYEKTIWMVLFLFSLPCVLDFQKQFRFRHTLHPPELVHPVPLLGTTGGALAALCMTDLYLRTRRVYLRHPHPSESLHKLISPAHYRA